MSAATLLTAWLLGLELSTAEIGPIIPLRLFEVLICLEARLANRQLHHRRTVQLGADKFRLILCLRKRLPQLRD